MAIPPQKELAYHELTMLYLEKSILDFSTLTLEDLMDKYNEAYERLKKHNKEK